MMARLYVVKRLYQGIRLCKGDDIRVLRVESDANISYFACLALFLPRPYLFTPCSMLVGAMGEG